jgi:hypothetical protein
MAILIQAVPFVTLDDWLWTVIAMACGAALYAVVQQVYTEWRQQ